LIPFFYFYSSNFRRVKSFNLRWSVVITMILLLACRWNKHQEATFFDQPKRLDSNADYTGTLWQTGEGRRAIYFSTDKIIIYSFFSPAMYEENETREVRETASYAYNSGLRTFTISRIGTQYDIVLKVLIDSATHVLSLSDPENHRQWFPETNPVFIDKAR